MFVGLLWSPFHFQKLSEAKSRVQSRDLYLFVGQVVNATAEVSHFAVVLCLFFFSSEGRDKWEWVLSGVVGCGLERRRE